MSDIITGQGLNLQYNTDTGNRSPQGVGNVTINEVNTFPVLTIKSESNTFETYNSEYKTVLLSDGAVEPFQIVVNYLPDDTTHQFLDTAAEDQTFFQMIIQYDLNMDESTITYAIVNGYITSTALSGDKDSVVTKSYTFHAEAVAARMMTTAALLPVYQGDYGVGSNTTDVPQYAPTVPTGNSFIKVPSTQAGNPAGADMMGVGLVDGTSVVEFAMTKTGTLSLFAKNATTAWTRIYTATQMDARYVQQTRTINGHVLSSNVVLDSTDTGSLAIENNLSDLDDAEVSRTNLDVYSKSEIVSFTDSVQNNLDTYIASNNEVIDSINTTIIVNKNQVDELSDTVDGINSNISDLADVVNTNKTQVDNYITSNNEVIDSINITISDLSDSVDARFVNVVLKTTTVNGKPLTGNITLTKSDVGLGNVTNDAQLKVASNLSDVANVDTARSNLKVDRLKQLSNQTQITNASGDGWLYAGESGLWGYRGSDSTWKPLGIAQGGTGSLTVKGARDNLQAMYRSQASLETTDLNTVDGLNCGFYYQTMTASATAERNYPLVEAGGLIVYQTGANGGPSCIQEYTTFSSLRKFVRSLSGGVWSEWIEQPKLSGNNAWTGINNFSNDLQITGNITSSATFPLKLVSTNPTIQFMETDSGGSNYVFVADGGNFRLSRDGTGGATIFNYVRDDNSLNIGQGVLRMVGNTLPTSQGIGVGGYRAIEPGNDYAGFDNMNNINITSWYGIGFCTAYTSPLNGIVAGKPAVYINTRNGTLAAKNAVFANTTQLTSDRNAKDNIEEIPDDDETIEKILGLKTYTFNFKNSGQPSAGFIAQEVQEVFPDYVQFVEDIKHYSLDYTAVNAYLHKAVVHYTDKTKVLEAQVETLKSTIQEQQAQIDELTVLVQQLLDNK